MSLKFVNPGEGEGADEIGFKVRDLEFTANISYETLEANLKAASARQGAPWLEECPEHDGTALIVAGGPSLATELEYIRHCQDHGEIIFAVNNVPAFLERNGITPDCHILLDSLPWVADFVHPHIPMVRYYSSQCDPAVHDLAPNCILWTPHMIGLEQAFPNLRPPFVIGGTTVGTRALGLAYILGYRKFRLFGLDSSNDGDRHHAYEQIAYENEALDVKCGGKSFKAPLQLIAQAEEFQNIINLFMAEGCEISVYGNGLLRALADEMQKQSLAAAS
jgi:hypothetical protein